MLGLLILLALVVPVAAIAGFILAINNRDRLRHIERRLTALEGRLAASPVVPAVAQPTPPVPEEPRIAAEPVVVVEPAPEIAGAGSPEPVPPSRAPVRARPSASLEERLGTQWVVWAGGLALVLGGFFLVRYAAEQGWFGPGMRVIMGAILALALIGAGEWTRRNEIHTGIGGLPAAHIPSILTAAGTAIAYADVYAAYALYHFIGPAIAFLLLGAVALGTLAAALVHGPALAGLGLIGAFVTPLIVSTEQPSYWALYIYLFVVTAASFALARARLWRWLAIATIVFAVLWTLPGIGSSTAASLTPHVLYIGAGYVLAALLIVAGFIFGPEAAPGRIDFVSSGALGAYLLASAFLVLATRHDALALALFALLAAGTLAIAWRSEAAAGAVPIAALLVGVVFLQWMANFDIAEYGLPSTPDPGDLWEPERSPLGPHVALGLGFSLLFGIIGYLAQGRFRELVIARLWAASAVFTPLAVLIALYCRIAAFDRSIPFATAALLLAAIFAFATESLNKRPSAPGLASAVAIFATGAIAALALGFTMALEKGWLTIALALIVPGIAWIATKRPYPALRWLAALIAVVLIGRIEWDPRIVGDQLGSTPIFNWLLYGYGVPAVSFWLAGYLMRRTKDDTPLRVVEATSLLFTVLLFFFEVRHALTGGYPYATGNELAEWALDVCIALSLAIGLERIRLRSGSIVHDLGAMIIAAIALAEIAFGLGLSANPELVSIPVGERFFNLILLGYGLPALLAGGLALVTRDTRPRWYSSLAAAVSVGLGLAYLSLEIRRLYHGPILTEGLNSDAEQYTYSAVWLAFGVALLAVGIWLRSLPIRIASAAVILLTVLKVFLIDMSDLEGIYRALSFLGLGAVLMGIGWFYQRLLFPRRTPEAAADPA